MLKRPALYSSPIQHVLVLQEEDEDEATSLDDTPRWNGGLSRPTTPTPPSPRQDIPYLWRVRDRMRTSHGVLVLCLNVGCDPPATAKPQPCAILEAWIDPKALPPTDSIKSIAHALKAQYERWQLKTKYKVAPDPTVIDLKRVCANLRRAAKDERVLFHYNGHGVPKPTEQGEIWVFNQNYSHYIPFNLLDLHEVLASPTLYIFDCNSAGVIFNHFTRVNAQLERRWEEACKREARQLPPPPHRNSIFLGACAAGETLPSSSSVPADLFTSCITTPLRTALHWFLKRTLVRGVTPDMLDIIPGNLNNRHTPLGELNWIFTAITDTIAWNVLSREMFKKLYRQDVLLAGLMRNFLLADRIMRSFACHPISHPVLPETHTHPLWESFELSMEQLLAQLPALLADEESKMRKQEHGAKMHAGQSSYPVLNGKDPEQRHRSCSSGSQTSQSEALSRPRYSYRSCSFFEDQMRAFDVWLDIGPEQRSGPEQLPIMLQVLLSPTLRVRALPMISRYLQTGPVAVDQALAVGIFPYVLRLLQSQSADMRQDLVFIWSKILALDDSCRSDLVKEKGEEYFVRFLMPGRGEERDPKPVYLAVAMFVLSVLARDYADRCRAVGTLEACYTRLSHESSFVRRWACLCLTEIIQRASVPSQSQAMAWTDLVQTLRNRAKEDEAPDVRAAAISTLSAIMNGVLQTLPEESNDAYSVNARQGLPRKNGASHTGLKPETGHTPAFPAGPNGLASETLDANGKLACDDIFMENESEILDAPVHPLSRDEREAILSIGDVIAEVGRWESSVLVRREVAIAIAKAVKHCEDRFLRAAYVTDVVGTDEEIDSIRKSDLEECEAVYRRLWISLSDLAYDPHPIIAALARRSYDIICDKLGDNSRPMSPVFAEEDLSKAFSSSNGTQDATKRNLKEFTQNRSFTSGKTGTQLRSDGSDLTKLTGAGHLTDTSHFTQNSNVLPLRTGPNKSGGLQRLKHVSAASPPRMNSNESSKGPSPVMGRPRRRFPPTDPLLAAQADEAAAAAIVHVRSESGSFNLDAPSRLSKVYQRIPRVNSFTYMSLKKNSPDATRLGISPPERSRSTMSGSFDLGTMTQQTKRPRPMGQSALATRVGALVKTFSQQFNLSALAGPQGRSPVGPVSGASSESSTDTSHKGTSPTRQPRRSQSYQVLNAAAIFSPRRDVVMFEMSRHTSYVKPSLYHDKSPALQNRKIASMLDRLFLSSAGDAALSLYEWSSASISKVEATATSDAIQEDESFPRYAALWHKFTSRGGDIPVEDNLRAFARLGESDSLRLGPIVDANEKGNDFEAARQLSLFPMGAGGGAITAMAFLPRDSGMGDDQLLATGDSTESVGVYDVRTGKRQGTFRVPSPPGVPEVGISALLCLNNTTSSTMRNDGDQPNSHSAIILAGAYNGRVGVFKSDYQGRKYRVMSTFQASGPSFYRKAGTSQDRSWKLRSASLSRDIRGSFGGKVSAQTIEERSTGFANAVRDTGNGLALTFDPSSSFLAAGGCDNEIVRVWDLRREQCVWEGAAVQKGTIPTALCMWSRVNPNLFVVGSSGGYVNVIDMRERSSDSRDFKRLGSHSEPVISIGTCPRGKSEEGETVVAADIGGQIAFWEPRWNDESSERNARNDDTTRIKAHSSIVAAMAVHRSGRYVASGSLFGSSAGRSVKIFGPNRRIVKMIRHFERPSGTLLPYDNRISPVTSLTFERETSLLAIGCIDSSAMIYGRPEHISTV